MNFPSVLILIAGLLLLGYTIAMSVILNFNTGTIITAVVSVLITLSGIFYDIIIASVFLRILALCIILFLSAFVFFVFISGRRETVTFDEDVVIVLGAGINGEKIPPQLRKRLDKAIFYHKKNPTALIVVSGGKGSDEKVTEASAMKKYLLENGIREELIITEESSVSTYTNFVNTKAILEERLKSDIRIAFITSHYHIFRASVIAANAGVSATHCGSGIEWYAIPIRYFRECAAIVKLIFTGH